MPSFHRVVALNVPLSKGDLPRLSAGAPPRPTRFEGKAAAVAAAFEAKPGGGGHVIFRREGGADVRLLVEDDLRGVRAAAMMLPSDDERPEDVWAKTAIDWMKDVLHVVPAKDEAPRGRSR